MVTRFSLYLALCCALWLPLRGEAQSLPAPLTFEAIAVSPTEIRLFWRPAAGANGYRIERDGKVLATLSAEAGEYTDKGLEPDRPYRYVLRAVHAAGESGQRVYWERTFATFPEGTGKQRVPVVDFDIVVLQASSSGVAAAIEAARHGSRTALLEPTTRLGGMPVNGLSASDLRRDVYQSGFFVRFRNRVSELYAQEGIKADGRKYEPYMAHKAMKSLLYEVPENLTIFRRARLAYKQVRTETLPNGRKRVTSVLVEELGANGEPTGRKAEFRAKIFIDASDSGDLAAWAGAPFRIGREPKSAAEPHNGVIYYDRKERTPLPGSTGAGDKRIQSYGYLLTVKDYGPDADKTLPAPKDYNRTLFDEPSLPTWKSTWAVSDGSMPNNKYELNQHPRGGDLQEINYGYATGDYRHRQKVDSQYRDHVLKYLYYIQTVYGMKSLGLPDDEYRDSGGFPSLLYVREGRRILGEQLPTEADITNARQFFRPESIGIGDYPMDSHAVRKKTDNDPRHMGEGEWWLYAVTPWHQLPFGVMNPQKLENVLVSLAVSSTHVSYGTYRMEPVRMGFGQTAGIAANLALRYHLAPRDVPVRQIQEEMLPRAFNLLGDPNLILHFFPDLKPDHKFYRAIQYMACRGFLPDSEKFAPDAPTTRGELAKWLRLLTERGITDQHISTWKAADGSTVTERPDTAYMGQPTSFAALPTLESDKTKPITRAEFAQALAQTLRLTDMAPNNYGDLAGSNTDAILKLAVIGIDSRIWDGLDAYAPDGKWRFRPDAPLNHADAIAALYLAQIGLGPRFYDHPIDGRNGRQTPAAPREFVVLSAARKP